MSEIPINKSKGKWYNYKIWMDRHTPTEIDDLAYHLYCKKRRSKYCQQQIVILENKITYKKYYIEAKQLLRNEKLNKICQNL